MAGPKLFDRVKDTSTTTGTGTLALANSAPTGFRTFGSVLSDGDTVFYCISSSGGSEWEVGIGTYTASGTTLARTTVLASSTGSAVSFSSGSKDVFCPIPGDFLNQLSNPTAAFASLAAYKAGRVLFPSDGFSLYRDSGSALVPWGPLFPLTDPALQTFAWVNQGSATVATTQGGVYLDCVSNGATQGLRLRKKAAPATPYTVTAAFLLNTDLSANSFFGAGLTFRQSSDGKLVSLSVEGQVSNVVGTAYIGSGVKKFTDANTFSASYAGSGGPWFAGPVVWMRLADDGANRKCSVSADGQNFIPVHSIGRTDFLTADEVGFFVNPYGTRTGMTLLSWKEA